MLLCMTTLCWSTCNAKCLCETGYASLGRDLHCTQSNEEIKGVWRQKQEAICQSIHPSTLALPRLPRSFPWSTLYHIETISSINKCSLARLGNVVAAFSFCLFQNKSLQLSHIHFMHNFTSTALIITLTITRFIWVASHWRLFDTPLSSEGSELNLSERGGNFLS